MLTVFGQFVKDTALRALLYNFVHRRRKTSVIFIENAYQTNCVLYGGFRLSGGVRTGPKFGAFVEFARF